MRLIKYDDLCNPPEAIDRWFDLAFREPALRCPSFLRRFPLRDFSIDLYDDEANYYAVAELPGVDKKDIAIELENAILTIRAERRSRDEDEERSYRLSRAITVSDAIKRENVTAKFENGVLKVTLPKAEERKPRPIEIH